MARRRRRGFGQLRRLPSRRWQAFYTGPDTQLHYAPVTFETAEDAEAWLTDERRVVASGAWTSPVARAHRAREESRRRQENVFFVLRDQLAEQSSSPSTKYPVFVPDGH